MQRLERCSTAINSLLLLLLAHGKILPSAASASPHHHGRQRASMLLAHISLASASYVSWTASYAPQRAPTGAVSYAPQRRSVRSPHPAAVASLVAPPDARPAPTERYSVALVALGCPKNTVDAEVMLGDLQRYGMRIVAKPEEADIVCAGSNPTAAQRCGLSSRLACWPSHRLTCWHRSSSTRAHSWRTRSVSRSRRSSTWHT